MPSDSFEQLLDRAASWFGIGGGFWDIFGHYHTTSVAAKQSILRALGVAADSSADLEQALATLARIQWERLLPPVVVAAEAGPMELPLHVAAERLTTWRAKRRWPGRIFRGWTWPIPKPRRSASTTLPSVRGGATTTRDRKSTRLN